eukprot:403331120
MNSQQNFYSSQDGKENISDDSNGQQENELKRRLYENMKKAGILDGLKSNMRGRLYEQLKLKNDKSGLNIKDQSNRLSFKLAISIIADLMQKCDMQYALSVFLPECGIQQEILSKPEILEVLKLDKDENYLNSGTSSKQSKEITPLLIDLMDILKQNGSVKPNMSSCYIQTEEAGEESLSLDQKLRKIDNNYMEKQDIERLMPFKALEERMLKYKQECDLQYKMDLENEVRRLREFESSKIRMDEAQKYRLKLQEYRDDLEKLQQDKLKELKIRENEAWERIKNKERDLDKISFEYRQKQLRDEEVMRSRESEVKKTIELEQLMLRNERDHLNKTSKDYELKLKEIDVLRAKLAKDHLESIENFKSEFQRKFQDQDFENHRRKLQIEEDEQKIKLEKERMAMIENKNVKLIKDFEALDSEVKKLRTDNQEMFRTTHDQKDQLRILNENLRRETEVGMAKEKQCNTYEHENTMLKQLLEDLKQQSQTYKDDQSSLIENLRLQLNETREMIVKMRENKDKEHKKLKERYEDERRREAEKYQFEYEKLKNEIAIMQKRLGQEEHFSKELAILNNKLQTNMSSVYREKDSSKVTHSHFYHNDDFDRDVDDGNDSDESEAILKRKQAWAELEREQEEVKRNIKSLMKTAPESRVIEDPMLADRVRNVRYEPAQYNQSEQTREEKKQKQSQTLKHQDSNSSKDQDDNKKHSNKQSQPRHETTTQNKKKDNSPKRSSTQNVPSTTNKIESKPQQTELTKPKSAITDNVQSKKPSPIKEEEKYQPSVNLYGNYGASSTTTNKNLASAFDSKQNSATKPAANTQQNTTTTPSTTTTNNALSSKPTFKPSTNPFAKRPSSSGSNSGATGNNNNSDNNTQNYNNPTSYGGYGNKQEENKQSTSIFPDPFAKPSSNTGTYSNTNAKDSIFNRNNSLKKSAEKEKERTQNSDIISDHLVDDYEDDFVEESVRNPPPASKNDFNKSKPTTTGGNVFGQPFTAQTNNNNAYGNDTEEASEAFEEDDLVDDYF